MMRFEQASCKKWLPLSANPELLQRSSGCMANYRYVRGRAFSQKRWCGL